jgi:hypothetical protein
MMNSIASHWLIDCIRRYWRLVADLRSQMAHIKSTCRQIAIREIISCLSKVLTWITLGSTAESSDVINECKFTTARQTALFFIVLFWRCRRQSIR